MIVNCDACDHLATDMLQALPIMVSTHGTSMRVQRHLCCTHWSHSLVKLAGNSMMGAQTLMNMHRKQRAVFGPHTSKNVVVAWPRAVLDRPVTEKVCLQLQAALACAGAAGSKDKKKETKLGLTAKKAENFPDWYTEVVREAELISYYTVSGQHQDLISPHRSSETYNHDDAGSCIPALRQWLPHW